MKDIAGQKFGELTAVRPTKNRYFGSIVWECRCLCGKTCYVPHLSLCRGLTKSCGHIRYEDLRGLRFSRLVAIRPLSTKSQPKKWLCRCDCGGVMIATSSDLKTGNTKSCGCISRKMGKPYARCPSCGGRFPIVLGGGETPQYSPKNKAEEVYEEQDAATQSAAEGETPQFCETCGPKYTGRAWRVCPVCKKLFPSPPSSNAVTCSKECSAQWKSIVHQGVSNKWTYEAKVRLSERGQTDNLRMGTAAAQKSPIAGRFETNQEAKIWILVDPVGQEYVVRNLRLWAREHTELFGKPPGDRSADQIAAGFRAIVQTLKGNRGAPGKPRGSMSYYGWTFKSLPEKPP